MKKYLVYYIAVGLVAMFIYPRTDDLSFAVITAILVVLPGGIEIWRNA